MILDVENQTGTLKQNSPSTMAKIHEQWLSNYQIFFFFVNLITKYFHSLLASLLFFFLKTHSVCLKKNEVRELHNVANGHRKEKKNATTDMPLLSSN